MNLYILLQYFSDQLNHIYFNEILPSFSNLDLMEGLLSQNYSAMSVLFKMIVEILTKLFFLCFVMFYMIVV
jgi:hypothetical protein